MTGNQRSINFHTAEYLSNGCTGFNNLIGSQTGSIGVLISPLIRIAFLLSRVRAFARIQQNMDFPLPGLPQTVMIFAI